MSRIAKYPVVIPEKVEITIIDAVLTVKGLDAIDGTPVLDIKPYMTEFAPRQTVRQPTWSHELMAGYFNEAAP